MLLSDPKMTLNGIYSLVANEPKTPLATLLGPTRATKFQSRTLNWTRSWIFMSGRPSSRVTGLASSSSRLLILLATVAPKLGPLAALGADAAAVTSRGLLSSKGGRKQYLRPYGVSRAEFGSYFSHHMRAAHLCLAQTGSAFINSTSWSQRPPWPPSAHLTHRAQTPSLLILQILSSPSFVMSPNKNPACR